jgi:hypothetical protein
MARRLNPWNPPNARFWVFWNYGPVKLTLEPGQSLTAHRWERTDEGWSSETEIYRHEGDRVRCKAKNDGRDCDGRLTSLWEGEAMLDGNRPPLCHFNSFQDEKGRYFEEWTAYRHNGGECRRMEFKTVEESQRDEYAEAAGY